MGSNGGGVTIEADGEAVEVTHADKVLVPGPDGEVTKADLARYWVDVARWVLPHLAGRPLSLRRYPDGIDAGGFVQQDAGRSPPHGLGTVDTPRRESSGAKDDLVHHPRVDSAADLVRLTNLGALEVHGWCAVAGSLERPDRVIVDIDPGESASLAAVRAAARRIGAVVEERGLVAFVQSTGSRGYHVVAPLDGTADHTRVRALAAEIAEQVAGERPGELTTQVRKDARQGRTFLDVGRNAYGQTAVMPYSPRARPGAPVATPLDWRELGRAKPDGHTVTTVARRLGRKSDPWVEFAANARPAP